MKLTPEPVGSQSGEGLGFRLGRASSVLVFHMPLPVPSGEAEEAAQYSASALSGEWQLPTHEAHLMVMLQEPEDRPVLDSLTEFTQVLAAVTEASGAIGVYWGDAHATHAPDFFCEVASDPESLPILLWTGLSIAHDGPGRISILSLGVSEQLGFEDLLLTAPEKASEDALAYFFDLIAYCASRGAAIPEGETVGRSRKERLRVRYVESPIDPQKRVWRVDLPS